MNHRATVKRLFLSRLATSFVDSYLLHTSVFRTILFNLAIAIVAAAITIIIATLWTGFIASAVQGSPPPPPGQLASVLAEVKLSTTRFSPSRAKLVEQYQGQVDALCIKRQDTPIHALAVSNRDGVVSFHAWRGCTTDRDRIPSPVRTWKIAEEEHWLGPLLPDYKVSVYRKNLSDLVFSRLGPQLGSADNMDRAKIASDAIASELFSFLEADQTIARYEWLAKTSSVYHRTVLFVFIFGLVGSLLIYQFAMNDPAGRQKYTLESLRSRLRFYHEIIISLPTISLICTMIGLILTLMEFVNRSSPDPTEAMRANSAALGGITLAFTTTAMASTLFIFGWNLILVTADARLVAEYEDDARKAARPS